MERMEALKLRLQLEVNETDPFLDEADSQNNTSPDEQGCETVQPS